MKHCKNANRPEIFKLEMKPKFLFYRDETSEKVLIKQTPKQCSFNIQKGLDERGDPPRSKSIIKMEDRISMIPDLAITPTSTFIRPKIIK